MADEPKPSRILSLEDALAKAAARPPRSAKYDLATHDAVQAGDATLQQQIDALHDLFASAKGAIEIHQAALLELVPVVAALEHCTLAGRIRRARAWWALQWERGRRAGEEFKRAMGR